MGLGQALDWNVRARTTVALFTTPFGGNQPSVCWFTVAVPGIIDSAFESPDRSRMSTDPA